MNEITATPAEPGPLQIRLENAFVALCSFGVAILAALEPMIAATYETFNPVRQAVCLAFLIMLAWVVRPWVLLTRETMLYIVFTAYMFVTLIWAPSFDEGMNTLIPAVDFVLLSVLFGSLVAFHNLRAVLTGALTGYVIGAIVYTKVVGFPFSYPLDFSYNAVAGMYLFGLFITLVYAWQRRSRLLPMPIALISLLLIAATTSIKTNLGIALGAGASMIAYARISLRMVRRNVILLSLLVAALVSYVLSNQELVENVQWGLTRASHGVEILQRREDTKYGTSYGERTVWKDEGIKGWERSPLFGSGVEAFRTDHGITSHSTPIDLLYNFGLIGLGLYYAMFASVALRLWRMRGAEIGSLPALIFAGLVCYSFITLSGTMHYNTFLAIYFAVSVALLRRFGPEWTVARTPAA